MTMGAAMMRYLDGKEGDRPVLNDERERLSPTAVMAYSGKAGYSEAVLGSGANP